MRNTTRVFVAVEIDAGVRRKVLELVESLRQVPADVKWVQQHSLHLTLQFLGEVVTREIPQVCKAVEAGVADIAPFQLELRGAGAFPNAQRPRTLWLGAAGGRDEMITLQKRIEAALKQLGFRPEHRRFEPHLTIGRVRSGGPALVDLGQTLKLHADFDAGRCLVDQAVVFSSQLQPEGPVYTALCRSGLGGK